MQHARARLLLVDDVEIDNIEVRIRHFTCGAPRQVRSGHRGRRGVCAQEKVKTGYFPGELGLQRGRGSQGDMGAYPDRREDVVNLLLLVLCPHSCPSFARSTTLNLVMSRRAATPASSGTGRGSFQMIPRTSGRAVWRGRARGEGAEGSKLAIPQARLRAIQGLRPMLFFDGKSPLGGKC